MPDHVRRLQRVAAGLLASVGCVAVVVASVGPRGDGPRWLALLAAIAGAVAPVAGARLHERMLASPGPVARRYERAVLVALAAGESAALLGLTAVLLTGEPLAWIGVATFVLLCGAYWPGELRWNAFERRAREATPGATDG